MNLGTWFERWKYCFLGFIIPCAVEMSVIGALEAMGGNWSGTQKTNFIYANQALNMFAMLVFGFKSVASVGAIQQKRMLALGAGCFTILLIMSVGLNFDVFSFWGIVAVSALIRFFGSAALLLTSLQAHEAAQKPTEVARWNGEYPLFTALGAIVGTVVPGWTVHFAGNSALIFLSLVFGLSFAFLLSQFLSNSHLRFVSPTAHESSSNKLSTLPHSSTQPDAKTLFAVFRRHQAYVLGSLFRSLAYGHISISLGWLALVQFNKSGAVFGTVEGALEVVTLLVSAIYAYALSSAPGIKMLRISAAAYCLNGLTFLVAFFMPSFSGYVALVLAAQAFANISLIFGSGHYLGRINPQDKLVLVRSLAVAGLVVFMVGQTSARFFFSSSPNLVPIIASALLVSAGISFLLTTFRLMPREDNSLLKRGAV
jgi:hypothetical protein